MSCVLCLCISFVCVCVCTCVYACVCALCVYVCVTYVVHCFSRRKRKSEAADKKSKKREFLISSFTHHTSSKSEIIIFAVKLCICYYRNVSQCGMSTKKKKKTSPKVLNKTTKTNSCLDPPPSLWVEYR